MLKKRVRHPRKVQAVSLFSERLKALRRQRGFRNQKSLADALSIKQQTISEYEKGGRDPLPPILIKMAETLDTTVDYLVGRTDDPEPPPNLSPRMRKLLAAVEALGHEPTLDDLMNIWLDNLPEESELGDAR